MRTFIAVDEARALVLEAAALLPAETVPLADALGRTLAESVVSRDAIPPFDNSAMDGYAVRTEDLSEVPAALRVIEQIPAGTKPLETVTSGTCAQIMTGAPLPPGADAIVPAEWTADAGEAAVRVLRAPAPDQYVRPAGQDVQPGDMVLEAGTVVTPPVIGMLATLGYAEVAVRRRPVVAVIATGDELVEAADTPRFGQIRNANGPALAAQVLDAGGVPLGPFLARDDHGSIDAALDEAAADVLVISGGVSVGAHDLVKAALDRRGFDLAFWTVRQRPGKPLAFGRLGAQCVFGLPGNPVSSAVCFEQYVRPVLRAMLGQPPRATYAATLAAPIVKEAGLHHFVRGRLSVDAAGRLWVRDTGPQASNLYSSVVRADVLIHLPEAMAHPAAGARVQVGPLPWMSSISWP